MAHAAYLPLWQERRLREQDAAAAAKEGAARRQTPIRCPRGAEARAPQPPPFRSPAPPRYVSALQRRPSCSTQADPVAPSGVCVRSPSAIFSALSALMPSAVRHSRWQRVRPTCSLDRVAASRCLLCGLLAEARFVGRLVGWLMGGRVGCLVGSGGLGAAPSALTRGGT